MEQQTFFAPAKRLSKSEIAQVVERLLQNSDFKIIDFIPYNVLLLNNCRQIIYCNKFFLETFKIDDPNTIYGLRPGELLNCINSSITSGGCGTSEFCKECKAVNTILSALDGKSAFSECHIFLQNYTEIFLQVHGEPFFADAEEFVFFTFEDITEKKMKDIIYKSFFVSLKNSISEIKMASQMIDASNQKLFINSISKNADEILDQINIENFIFDAYNNRITITPSVINFYDIVNEILENYSNYEFSTDNSNTKVDISSIGRDINFISDYRLLYILLKNILVLFNYLSQRRDSHLKFNARVDGETLFIIFQSDDIIISDNIKKQFFRKYFSEVIDTKYLYIYTIRLIIQKYLKGIIEISSKDSEGSTFIIHLPYRIEEGINES